MRRDLRKYAKQTNLRLLVGFFIVLVVVGGGLIYLIYGKGAVISGLVCMGAGLAPLVLIWLVMALIDRVVRKINEE